MDAAPYAARLSACRAYLAAVDLHLVSACEQAATRQGRSGPLHDPGSWDRWTLYRYLTEARLQAALHSRRVRRLRAEIDRMERNALAPRTEGNPSWAGSYHRHKLTHETPVQYITRQFTCEAETSRSTVLAAAAVRGTIYAAIRNEDRTTGASYVFCAVILFRNTVRDGFGYKDMDESMGPNAVDCPDRIMRLLSPVDQIPSSGYADDWRARVAAAKARRRIRQTSTPTLKEGDVVKLAHKVTVKTCGITTDRFRFLHLYKRTPVFEPLDRPGRLCRLTSESLAGIEVLT